MKGWVYMKKAKTNSLRSAPQKGWVVEKDILHALAEGKEYLAPVTVSHTNRLHSNFSLENPEEIITGCLNNDRNSQEQLYLSYYPSMFNLCKKFFANDEDVLEVLNDGMLKVFQHIASFDKKKGNLFNWIYTIVRNTAIDHLKKNKQLANRNDLQDVFESDHSPIEKMAVKDIYILLDHLTPATRAAFSLFYLEGFSIKEISMRTGISTGTVKWHLSEGRKKILPLLRKHIEG